MSKFSELSIREQGKIQGRIQELACAANICRLNATEAPFASGAKQMFDLANVFNAQMRQLIAFMREEENVCHYQEIGNNARAEEKAPHSAPALKRT